MRNAALVERARRHDFPMKSTTEENFNQINKILQILKRSNELRMVRCPAISEELQRTGNSPVINFEVVSIEEEYSCRSKSDVEIFGVKRNTFNVH